LNSPDAAPAFGVYIHWPFCLSKCPYCDFNSHVRHAAIDEARYVRAFATEIATTAARVPSRTVSTIFFGGGTPSLFAPETIERLIACVDRVIGLRGDAEITLEANPGTVNEARLAGFRAAGANRVSFGVQSFQENLLAARLHPVSELDIVRRVEVDDVAY